MVELNSFLILTFKIHVSRRQLSTRQDKNSYYTGRLVSTHQIFDLLLAWVHSYQSLVVKRLPYHGDAGLFQKWFQVKRLQALEGNKPTGAQVTDMPGPFFSIIVVLVDGPYRALA